MSRVNINSGADRDLDKPLIEVDPAAPRRVRIGQRTASIFIWATIWLGLIATGLLIVSLILIFVDS